MTFLDRNSWLCWWKLSCQAAAKEATLKIWDLLRAVHAHSGASGRPRLLLQHEILPLELAQQRDHLPFSLVEKRSKEVVFPVRQHQSNQQTMEESQGLPNKQMQSHLKERLQLGGFARQSLYQHKVSPINRVQMKKRFSGFRDLQRMNQLAKREEQTQALERPGNITTQRKEKEKRLNN